MKPENLKAINQSFEIQADQFENRALQFTKQEYLDQAAAIAVKTVWNFCAENPGKIDIVRFVLFNDRTLRTYDHTIFELEQAKA